MSLFYSKKQKKTQLKHTLKNSAKKGIKIQFHFQENSKEYKIKHTHTHNRGRREHESRSSREQSAAIVRFVIDRSMVCSLIRNIGGKHHPSNSHRV